MLDQVKQPSDWHALMGASAWRPCSDSGRLHPRIDAVDSIALAQLGGLTVNASRTLTLAGFPFTRIVEGVFYCERFVDDPDAALDAVMREVSFTQRVRTLYGRRVATPRLEAWHGPTPYRFGGSELPPLPLTPTLRALAVRIGCAVREPVDFDTCLANLYRDGRDSVWWHADDEPEMGDPIIASISLGAPRDFLLRRKDTSVCRAPSVLPARASVQLAHGSLLVMARGVQAEWLHSVPKRPGCLGGRVNLTYRVPG